MSRDLAFGLCWKRSRRKLVRDLLRNVGVGEQRNRNSLKGNWRLLVPGHSVEIVLPFACGETVARTYPVAISGATQSDTFTSTVRRDGSACNAHRK